MKTLLNFHASATAFLIACVATAQDIHFSQYNAAPLLLNPALAGMNNCDYRVYANFRIQWPTVSVGNTYRTLSAGADMTIGKVTKYNSFAGLGLQLFMDQAGALNFSNYHADLNFAYHFMLNRKGTMQISTGIQGAFNFRTIDDSKATFDSQYDPTTGTVNPTGLKENFARTRIIFGDAGLGALYSALTNRNDNFYLGFALHHLNQPKISFRPSGDLGNERLRMKITLHGGSSINVGKNNRTSLLPNFLVLVQGPANQFNVGLGMRSMLGNNTKTSKMALTFGMQYRGIFHNNFYDAVILVTRFEVKGFSAGLSYDINVSRLVPASGTIGAPEIALTYQGCYRKKPRPGHCPALF
ncbi:MAG: PorP/SprF family type IX secretion system membrane protein [Chitinophagales bacterium]|nr:PorP/SprF family type IX secretion system membrane protein [Chitinophagales bacterium]MDW8418318.1 PorP/SprF family type IX secretion system membrane protein [Chitinophagales bacterium]